MAHRSDVNRWHHQRWGMVIIVLVVIVLYYSGIMQPLLNRVITFIQVPQAWLFKATQSWRNNDTLSIEELNKKNDELNNRVKELVIENTTLQSVIKESTLLEEQLAFLQEKKYSAVPALITSTTADGLSKQFVLNRGTNHGISEGQAVIVNNGILVGIVTHAESTFSRMTVITSTSLRVGAQMQNQQASPGIISGEHELSLRMDYIPQFDTVALRTIVVTSGINPQIPEGLVIGEVTEVMKDPGALFQQAVVSPYNDNSQLSVVSVIIQ